MQNHCAEQHLQEDIETYHHHPLVEVFLSFSVSVKATCVSFQGYSIQTFIYLFRMDEQE